MTEMEQEQISNYVMPSVKLHEQVLYYPKASGSGAAIAASVVEVYFGGVRLGSLDPRAGVPTGQICHKSDPRLRLRPEMAKAGCWDFPEKYYQDQEWQKFVKRELMSLRQAIGRLKGKKGEPLLDDTAEEAVEQLAAAEG